MDTEKNRELILGRLKRFASQPKMPIKSRIARKTDKYDLSELYESFNQALTAVGGTAYLAKNKDDALKRLDKILSELKPSGVVLSKDNAIRYMGLRRFIGEKGINILELKKDPEQHKETSFRADIGITGADYALADTGTIVILHAKTNARLLSLAPPTHIAIVRKKNLLPNVNSFVSALGPLERGMPSAISFITGPSLTADIALQPTYGMHGPKKLFVIFE